MSLAQDFFLLLGGCIALFFAVSRAEFGLTLVIGIVLGALCWFACSRYSRLWNLRYRVTLTHHILCAVAAIFTLLFTVVFASLRYTKEAAYESVELWETQINHDNDWANRTFKTVWHKVKASGKEDFTNFPAPENGGRLFPMNNLASRRLAAATYAQAGVDNFNGNRPFLSKIIQAHTEVPSRDVDADVNRFFAKYGGGTYDMSNAVALVAKNVKSQLDEQLPRVVTTFRLFAVGLFLCVQLMPFGLVGIAAYRNLRVAT
jgi:hypothetical protein